MYRILSNPQPVSILGGWSSHLGSLSQVVGFSLFGHTFLREPGTNTFAVLHPFKSAVKKYPNLKDTEAFIESVLQEPTFIEFVLRPADVAMLEERLGPLGQQEVYFPVPYPFVGGSGELSTYDKGDYAVFMRVVAHMHGHASASAAAPKVRRPWWRFWQRT